MSEMSEAFSELQEAKTEAIGKQETVLLNGKAIAAMVSEIVDDQSFISGGVAQGGIFRAGIAQSICKKPEKFTPIECRGQKLQVLAVSDVNGVTWEITAGDPSSEAQ